MLKLAIKITLVLAVFVACAWAVDAAWEHYRERGLVAGVEVRQ